MAHDNTSAPTGSLTVRQRFVRSAGPRGQNPRHKASAVELRLDVSRSDLPEDAKARLMTVPGLRLTRDGVLVVTARNSNSQRENSEAARAHLLDLVLQSLQPPVRRRRTRPPRLSSDRRLADKHRTAERKRARHDRSGN